jgi:Ion transport protein
MVIFTVEYVVKFWAAPSRWRFFWGFWNILDLVSIVPWYVDVAVCGHVLGCTTTSATVKSTQVRSLVALCACAVLCST